MEELKRQIDALPHIAAAYRQLNSDGTPKHSFIRVISTAGASEAHLRSIARKLGLTVRKPPTNMARTHFDLMLSHPSKSGGLFHIVVKDVHDKNQLSSKPNFRVVCNADSPSIPLRRLILSFFEELGHKDVIKTPALKLVKPPGGVHIYKK